MFTVLKANVASLVASAFDYGVTIIAVQFFSVNVVIAGIIGTVCGAIIHFIIGKHWVFVAHQLKSSGQAKKYFLIWLGNLALNATGMYVFTKMGVNYIVTKVGTSILVGWAYNYPLQKGYVFKTGKV
ncbi:MAG TPA: GtrA family protein [Hanamia sp.]